MPMFVRAKYIFWYETRFLTQYDFCTTYDPPPPSSRLVFERLVFLGIPTKFKL